jgi:hypothetical protein
MREAAENLRLVNDFPGNESLSWKIDELYQRDIDWGRVEREIVPYLSSSEEPQFFNSLTIAFMPIRDNEVKPSFGGEGWDCPELSGFAKYVPIGPINVGYWADWKSVDEPGARIGQIRWNPQQVFSVAIDGQHRLAALKSASKGFDERADKTQVPVLLLLLDEQVGFRAPKGQKLVELMRTLFIALNKHSEQVSRPRQLLLDDKDPHSLCVRALVGDRITEGTREFDSGELPLSLVDWHSEQAKFEKGPYITTILGLDWIVEKTLRSKPIKDYSAYGSVSKQLRAISLSLGLNFHRPGSTTFDRFREIETQAVEPFFYTGCWLHNGSSEGELGAIVDAFRTTWAKGLVEVFTGFSPYAGLIALRKKDKTLSPEFTNWYFLRQRREQGERATEEYANFVNRLKNRKEHPINKAVFEAHLASIETMKEDNLAFKVAFQRALISAFLDFVTIDGTDIPELDTDENDGDEDESEEIEAGPSPKLGSGGTLCVKRAKQFVRGLNRLIESVPEFLDVKGVIDDSKAYIWHGSLYNKGANTIDFTLGASGRARDFVFIAAALALCQEQQDETIDAGFDAFWDGLEDSDVGVHKKIWKVVDRRIADQAGAGGRIVAERGDYSFDEAREEAKIRSRWMWESLDMPEGALANKKKHKTKKKNK